jgi:hypothetical protein
MYDGTVYTDSFTSLDYGGNSYIDGKGCQLITADGYGTLILPDTTYTNVLRVKKTFTVRRVQNILGQTFPATLSVDEVYEWYSDFASRTYLLQVSNHISTVNVEDAEILAESFDIYPNPATDDLSIKTNGAALMKSLSLKDITGKTIIEEKINADTYSMHVNGISTGLYYLDIQTDKGTVRRKLQIQ